MQDFDIVVAGAGPVGLAFAASLAGAGLRIALVDPQPAAALADPADDGREIALTDRSVATLRALGAWARVPEAAVAPLRRMQVLNGPSRYAMQFGATSAADGPVGRFAPNHWLRRALHEVVQEQTGAVVMPELSVASVRARAARLWPRCRMGKRSRHGWWWQPIPGAPACGSSRASPPACTTTGSA